MDNTVSDLLVPGVPVLEKVLRPIVVYAFLVIALRLAGKRELGQLNTFDFVVLLLLSNTVQNAVIGNDNSLSGGIIGASTLFCINYLTNRMLFRFETLSRVVEGTEVLLIDQGRLLRGNLDRQLITEDELLTVCHRQGIERIEDVDKAILETGGTISLFKSHPTRDEAAFAGIDRRLASIERLLRDRSHDSHARSSSS